MTDLEIIMQLLERAEERKAKKAESHLRHKQLVIMGVFSILILIGVIMFLL